MEWPTLLEIVTAVLYIGTIGYSGPAVLALMKKIINHEKA
jgi:chromate transport protein ChrA